MKIRIKQKRIRNRKDRKWRKGITLFHPYTSSIFDVIFSPVTKKVLFESGWDDIPF